MCIRDRYRPEQPPSSRPSQKMLLVRRFIVRISRRKHHAFNAQLHHLVKKLAHALRVGAIKKRGVRRHAKPALHRFPYASHRQLVPAFAANRKIVMLFLPVHVHGKRQVFARLEKVQLFFQKQRIRAQINVLLARHQPFHDLGDLRMHQRFAAEMCIRDRWGTRRFAATRSVGSFCL